MDDMYGMLFSTLSPEMKLRTAITNNMFDCIVQLIEAGGPALINAPLYTENRRTALHLACKQGYHVLVKILIDAGGNVNEMDLFGLTPLVLALCSGHENCARIILQNSSWHPGMIWEGGANIPRWVSYSEEILCFMVIGTPNLMVVAGVGTFQFNYFLELCEKYLLLMKVFYLTGNQIPVGHILQLNRISTNMSQWIRAAMGVQTLSHYARIAVRRSLNTNVFYSAKQLPLPVALQKYLQFIDELKVLSTQKNRCLYSAGKDDTMWLTSYRI